MTGAVRVFTAIFCKICISVGYSIQRNNKRPEIVTSKSWDYEQHLF